MSGKENKMASYFGRALAFIGSITMIYAAMAFLFGDRVVPTATAQTDRYLESRLSQIEQRFYQLESRLNRIEQDSITRRMPTSPQISDTREQEMNLLANEVSGLRLRLGEVECGLLRLDERTLPAARRLGGRTTGSDRCRLDWSSPVQLSARP